VSPVDAPLIEVTDLVKHFPIKDGIIFQKEVASVRAVDGVSFTVGRGETLGLVGESGCGKSTTARLLMRLLEPTSGSIVFDGRDISGLDRSQLMPLRREMQMIFQDPYSSLNPRATVGSIIGEALQIHKITSTDGERKQRVRDLMDRVGLNPEHYNRFPHEFSGGQRQRIGIARAIAVRPRLVVADEPVSALDVSIQAQILNLLAELKRELGLTIVFIAHDLSVVRHVCDRIAVMYLGRIMESADAEELFRTPRHPYTAALLSAVPVPDPAHARSRARQVLVGDIPSPTDPPSGCRFHPRCPQARAVTGASASVAGEGEVPAACAQDLPELSAAGRAGHEAACWYPLGS
jgi:peptide/nickel transport system ATP-binding protein/oligopeptide transport system ATP-binding protein